MSLLKVAGLVSNGLLRWLCYIFLAMLAEYITADALAAHDCL
jgi:hypothetical protein